MFRDPAMYRYLVEEHQRELLREAALERLARQAQAENRNMTLSTHARVRISALLFALGRMVQPREVRSFPVVEFPHSLT